MESSLYMAVMQMRIQIRSDPVFLGHPDPDPGKYVKYLCKIFNIHITQK